MEVWEFGPRASDNLAGSVIQKLVGRTLAGRPTTPDGEWASRSVDLAVSMSHEVPVLHDISDGGLAVALAEICIASGVGALVEADNPFSEDPHRFLAVAEAGAIDPEEGVGRLIGSIGGDSITINGQSVELNQASEVWHGAIPSLMNGDR
jgi:phosphoribosylformylglycinamidine synthase